MWEQMQRRNRGWCDGKTEAETGGMWPQVKEPQGWQPPPAAERGQEASSLGLSEGARPCQCLDFRLLASRTVREKISVVLRHPVWRNLLQQPRDTNPFCFEPWLMDQETQPGILQTQRVPRPAWWWLKSHSVWKIVFKVCVSSFSSRLGNMATIIGGEKRLLPLKMHRRERKKKERWLAWWLSDKASASQCRRHGFDPQSGMIQHASEQLRP